ncbi:MAG: HD domain-containing protein [Algicola sp.]|nr:HD domain-containing protein [Algicola sp.]
MHNNLLQLTEAHVVELLNRQLSPKNYYHNIQHTRRVVALVNTLAVQEGCNDKELLLLQLAAWFHDVGYVNADFKHEEQGAELATAFLTDKGLTPDEIQQVAQLILVTKKGIEPQNKLEYIIKDADCGHVGHEDFMDVSENLHTEISLKKGEDIPENDWLMGNVNFLKNHRFYTAHAKKMWQPQKEINQFRVQQKIDKLKVKKIKKAKENNKLGRGVETLFRVQLKNHIELSAIADTKANILLSVNAIIISVALTSLVPKLDNPSNAFLVIPTLVLTVSSVISIVLSVMSTRPKVSNVEVTRDMIKNKQTNILFFGNFYKMTLEEFEWGVDYLIENDDVLYNALTKDLYYLGLVLKRKYSLLRVTYTVFMIGIIISALTFMFSYYIIVSGHSL